VFADGTVRDYTYKADGWTADTVTETRPGQAPVVYQVEYAASGVRSHLTPS